MNHTSTPWALDGRLLEGLLTIAEAHWQQSKERSPDTAAFIVRACDAHDELLTMLKRFVEAEDGPDSDDYRDAQKLIEQLESAEVQR
ncbi:hypothetical protein [Mesorhizobium sp. B2-3-4]|uniref:hypothetical protein n=1 Tax=Mesorhizobium sp. B2-3-4 TaxID=2589959 RepID=UPI00112C41BE|nr:hypothetical protein [Mesorhizobium sp. B2-3-4]TPM41389.1 hypothetical protein FJ967_00180 [Mesorhizobium sp. B2-3-4]